MGCGASSARETNPLGSSTRSNNSSHAVGNIRYDSNGRPIHKSLTKPMPFAYGRPITKQQLDLLRDDFWSSRVEGNSLMWQALKTISEALLNDDLPLASAILEASNITTPTGLLDICYDERGHQYAVPNYCFSNPLEINEVYKINHNNNNKESTKTLDGKLDDVKTMGIINDLKVKLRINPGDYNVVLDVTSANTILDLKKMVSKYTHQSQGKIPECDDSQQRVMFMGKELQNNQTLSQAGIDDVRIVQIFIRPKKGI